MVLRGKFNGAKHVTEAWDFLYRFKYKMRRRKFSVAARSVGTQNSSAKHVVLESVQEVVGERRILGEATAEAVVDGIRVRMPE